MGAGVWSGKEDETASSERNSFSLLIRGVAAGLKYALYQKSAKTMRNKKNRTSADRLSCQQLQYLVRELDQR